MKNWHFSDYLLVFVLASMIISLGLTVKAILTTSGAAREQELFLLLEIILGIVILLLPQGVAWLGHFELPAILYTLFIAFIYGAVYLGTIYHFYSLVPLWDKLLHVGSAMLLGCLGYALFGLFTPKKQLRQLSPFMLSLFAFTFGLALGVFWEFYEFTFDGLLGLNMQRFMVGNTLLHGRAALMDTMGDLFADALGALIIVIVGYCGIKRNPRWLDKFLFRKK